MKKILFIIALFALVGTVYAANTKDLAIASKLKDRESNKKTTFSLQEYRDILSGMNRNCPNGFRVRVVHGKKIWSDILEGKCNK